MNDIIPDKKPAEAAGPDAEAGLQRAHSATEADVTKDEILDAEFLDAGDSEAETPQTTETAPESESPQAAPEETEVAEEPPAGTAVAAKPANLRWDIFFLLLLICVSLLRLGYLYIVPLDLAPDESYYWDWSRRLALGDSGEPPLIAWVNALSTKLLGVSAEAVRIPAVVFGALGLIGIYLCGRRLFNAEVGFWGVAAWLATPGAAALGLFMTTDVLLLSCWSLALYTLWRAIEASRGRFFWVFLTILLIGAGLLSTQMMLVFPLLLFLFLLFSGEDRRQLKARWPWLLLIGTLLFCLPLVYWNLQHGRTGFEHLIGSIEPFGAGWQDYLKTFAEFVGLQLGLLTPITWLLLMLLILSLLPQILRWSRQTRYLFCFSAFGLLAFTALSFNQSISPGNPAAFYPAGLLLLAAWGRQQIHGGMFNRLQRLFIPGLKLAVLFTLFAYLLPFALQLNFIPLGKLDPTRQVKGWSDLGRQVGEALQEQPRPEQTFVLSPRRSYPAEIAFYSPGNPITYKWPANPPEGRSQYELWPGPVDKLGWDALILQNADSPLPEDLVAAFEQLVDLGEKAIPTGAAGQRKYHLWRGENLLRWPE